MSIDIKGTPDRNIANLVELGKNAQDRAQPTPAEQTSGKASTADTVSLTDAAKQIADLQNTVADLPVVDSKRVEAIKQALAAGTYEIDAGRVADKLAGFETELDQDT